MGKGWMLVVSIGSSIVLSGALASAASATAPASLMVMSQSDFPDGAVLDSQSATAPTALASFARTSAYSRTFSSVVFNNEDVITLSSSALVAKKTSDVAKFMSAVIALTRSTTGKSTIVKGMQSAFSSKLKILSGKLLRARVLHVPDEALDLDISLKITGGTFSVSELWIERGPALAFTVTLSNVFTAGDSVALAKSVDAHVRNAFATIPPTNGVAPTISGTAQVSETLTAELGTWTGTSEKQIQWLRCSATGDQCAAIANATAGTYLVVAADVGSTLEVDVTATNGAGTTSSQSPPTAAVIA